MVETERNGNTPAQVREAVAQIETGRPGGVADVEKLQHVSAADVEAVEQEASEGPEGRGLAR